MSRRLFIIGLATALALAGVPLAAQSFPGLGQTGANGCEVYVGEGSGQIVSAWGEEPLSTLGSAILTSRDGARHYTYVFETIFFPSLAAGAGGARAHNGFESWRFEENGLRGTLRVQLVYTPDDPANPTTLALIGQGEVVGGNKFDHGGMQFSGTMDYYTGAYSIALFELVLCP